MSVRQSGAALNESKAAPCSRRRRSLVAVSGGVWLLSTFLAGVQPDFAAWLAIIPRSAWLTIGLALAIGGFATIRWRKSVGMVCLWGLYGVIYVEEVSSLGRSLRTSVWQSPQSAQIRVVSFNCGSGGDAAVKEAMQFRPDIVFLQESPQRSLIENIVRQHGERFSVLWSPDVVIVARGTLIPRNSSPDGSWTQATWKSEFGPIELVNLRLAPVPLRFDFWRSDCWRELSENRNRHRREVSEILNAVETSKIDYPCLVGGDFNAMAGDPSLSELCVHLRDAFEEAGRGWGNTITNECPVHRIDQIWVSHHWAVKDVIAVTSQVSDHRLVIGEFNLAPQ